MIRASDLIGCEIETESGKRVGRVHDLRAEETSDDDWMLVGLVAGRRGMLARFTGSDQEPLVHGDFIPWETITSMKDGLVIVRDNATH